MPIEPRGAVACSPVGLRGPFSLCLGHLQSRSLSLLSPHPASCFVFHCVVSTLGVHNYKRWGDIVTKLTNEETGVVITPQYCGGQHRNREQQWEKQVTSYGVKNTKGREISLEYVVAEGNDLKVNIYIK